MKRPKVSAVVLNWNGGELLLACLRSLEGQTIGGLEVLVVDNASTDDSLDRSREAFPGFRYLPLDTNTGYTGGMNHGIEASRGEYVALLNLDVELQPQYLELCGRALDADPTLGGVTGKLLKLGLSPDGEKVLDTTGHRVFRNRRVVDRGEGEVDRGQYDEERELFSVCGAAPVLRRTMLDDTAVDGEFLDEDFFSYFEDFDLSWRARLRGWRFAFVPEARGIHARGGSGGKASTFILACNHRNRLLTMIKNDSLRGLVRRLPELIYTEVRATFHMLFTRPAALFMAWGHLARLASRALRKRRKIRSRATMDPRQLEEWFEPYDYRLKTTLRRIKGELV